MHDICQGDLFSLGTETGIDGVSQLDLRCGSPYEAIGYRERRGSVQPILWRRVFRHSQRGESYLPDDVFGWRIHRLSDVCTWWRTFAFIFKNNRPCPLVAAIRWRVATWTAKGLIDTSSAMLGRAALSSNTCSAGNPCSLGRCAIVLRAIPTDKLVI